MSIIVKGSGGGAGGEDLTAVLTEQDALIQEIEESLVGKASGANITPETVLAGYRGYKGKTLVEGTLTASNFTADADATAEDIIAGKTAYVKGEKLTGTAIKGDGTWVETTTATTAGKTIYSAHNNPNAVYGGGYLPQTQESGHSLYNHACVGIWGTTIAKMTCTTTKTYGDGTPSVGTTSLTISGNKITIPSVAYGDDPAFTLRLAICHV